MKRLLGKRLEEVFRGNMLLPEQMEMTEKTEVLGILEEYLPASVQFTFFLPFLL